MLADTSEKDPEFFKTELIIFFNYYIIKSSWIPKSTIELIFPSSFFSSSDYLIFPLFFQKIFGLQDTNVVNKICCSSYLFFKYLICVDSLIDKDIPKGHENDLSDDILLLRMHIYQGESIKILGNLFDENSNFWNSWNIANKQFINSMLLDQTYNITMDFKSYANMVKGKCSFLKASAASMYYQIKSNEKSSYKDVIRSLDYLAVARCLLDDFEDFRKDLQYKKNNYGHILLNEWFKEFEIYFFQKSEHDLVKYFYVSKTAGNLLNKSLIYFDKAIKAVENHRLYIGGYLTYIENLKLKTRSQKLTIETYLLSLSTHASPKSKLKESKKQ